MDYTKLTLGTLLSSDNETIKRHAMGILKALPTPTVCEHCGFSQLKNNNFYCSNCGKPMLSRI